LLERNRAPVLRGLFSPVSITLRQVLLLVELTPQLLNRREKEYSENTDG
jgi:hypothetical protein